MTKIGSINPEGQLLLYCIRSYFDPEEETRFQPTYKFDTRFDWSRFYIMAHDNCVIAQTWSVLRTIADKIPREVVHKFEEYSKQTENHHAEAILEMRQVLMLLSRNNVLCIPFKGPILGELYKDRAIRKWVDLDILIKKQNIIEVQNLLRSIGYTSEYVNENSLESFMKTNHSIEFKKAGRSAKIDVHWRFTDKNDCIPYPVERIWERCKPDTVFDIPILTLDPESLLMVICIHHVLRNNCEEMRHAVDIAVILSAFNDLDCDELFHTAHKLKITRGFLVAVSLAHQLFDMPVPTRLAQAIAKENTLGELNMKIMHHFFQSRSHIGKKIIYILWNRISLRESFYIRTILVLHFIFFVLGYLLKPTAADTCVVSLPRYLYFLYYIIRPFRLMFKTVNRN